MAKLGTCFRSKLEIVYTKLLNKCVFCWYSIAQNNERIRLIWPVYLIITNFMFSLNYRHMLVFVLLEEGIIGAAIKYFQV